MLQALGNSIIFKFVDTVNSKGEFNKQTTAGGIILQSSFDDSAKQPRWIVPHFIGEQCITVSPQQLALVPNLRWTAASKFDNQSWWKTDATQVVAVKNTITNLVEPLSDYVIFTRIVPQSITNSGLIILTNQQHDTPAGQVISIGPDVDECLKSAVIYFDDTNFSNKYTIDNVEYSFIKVSDILAYELK